MKKIFVVFVFIIGLGYIAKACATDPDTISWKEEVVLHDGQKIIVDRSFTYGRYGELGQGRLVSGRTIIFSQPGNDQKIKWESDESISLIMLDFSSGVPYIVGIPKTCIAFNDWGKPNPPYVFFKYDGQEWKRIAINEFPPEFKEANIYVDVKSLNRTPIHKSQLLEETNKLGYLSAETVKKWNRDLSEFKRIIRREVITFGPGNWTKSCDLGPERKSRLRVK